MHYVDVYVECYLELDWQQGCSWQHDQQSHQGAQTKYQGKLLGAYAKYVFYGKKEVKKKYWVPKPNINAKFLGTEGINNTKSSCWASKPNVKANNLVRPRCIILFQKSRLELLANKCCGKLSVA